MKQLEMLFFIAVTVLCMGFAGYSVRGKVTVEPIGREQSITGTIDSMTKEFGLPRGMIETFIDVESKWKESAFNPEKDSKCYRNAKTELARAKCGAYGLMQPICGLHAGDIPCRDLFHGPTSILVAVKKQLGPCWKKTKSVYGAAKCFNGSGARAENYAKNFLKKFKTWS